MCCVECRVILEINAPCSGKFLQDKIFVDFAVGLTSTKINPRIRHNCVLALHDTPASVKNFIWEFSLFVPFVKI